MSHVSSLWSKGNFHLRKIGSCSYHITGRYSTALVISRLDFRNGLLSVLSAFKAQREQRTQNRATRLVFLTPPTLSATFVSEKLYWLPVRAIVSFSVLVYAYKPMNALAREYLSDLLTPYVRKFRLRQLHDELQLATPL